MRMVRSISDSLGIAFGWLVLALGIIVTGETVSRKIFSWSMQGADELGGYILAVTTTLSFCTALVGRYHMRIDTVHYALPVWAQAFLNWLSMLSVALFSLVLAWSSSGIIRDTYSYKSTAPTPWATPLIYPQSVWYGGILLFALTASILMLRASQLLSVARFQQLADEFQPKAIKEELREELEDAARR